MCIPFAMKNVTTYENLQGVTRHFMSRAKEVKCQAGKCPFFVDLVICGLLLCLLCFWHIMKMRSGIAIFVYDNRIGVVGNIMFLLEMSMYGRGEAPRST